MGSVNYLNFQLTPKDSVSVRNEYFDDINGQRTGTATRYVGHGLGWTLTSGRLVSPSVRLARQGGRSVLKLRILSAGVGLNKLYWFFSLGAAQAPITRRPAVSHVVAKSHVRRMPLLSQTPRLRQ
jgi:hypothetical protein